MTATLTAPTAHASSLARRVAPIWQAAQAAASLVARPAMARDEASASLAAGETSSTLSHPSRLAAVAAGSAFAGSTVGLAYFLSRKPIGSPGAHYAKFRA